ncbi:threonine-phosphate decarboxylase CobD [Paracoccus sp. (in: a-proteobacteria)]|uniref:threonine-phosphate decarboxylase CobD n=1 Tax=Paracoccus sp. TaxID=267 RepID=UPI003A85BB9D
MTRDHGGNIDRARARFGGDDWIDLSTGINRVPWPVPDLPAHVWTDLPTRTARDALIRAAAGAFGGDAPCIPLAGAQQAIQLVPRLAKQTRARVLGPTYNEHAASLRTSGWVVDQVGTLADLAGADLAVVVNPNNPDGQRHPPAALRDLAAQVGLLVVDESFADAHPDLSLLPDPGPALVLRSFGKFWGLAGLRLGFAFGPAPLIDRLAEMAGPWPVSGAAIHIGTLALTDRDWARATIARLTGEAARLDGLAADAGWRLVGGTGLFRCYETPDAEAAQDHLARARIWSRIFPYSRNWLRLGLPGSAEEWQRLAAAMPGPPVQRA